MFRRLNTSLIKDRLETAVRGRCKLISTVARPQFIAVAVQIARRCTSLRQGARILCIVISLPKEGSRPRKTSLSRTNCEPRQGRMNSPVHHFPNGIKCPSSLSFLPYRVLGTTPRRQTTSPLPCRESAGFRPFYLRHTPRLRLLNHLEDIRGTGNHSGSHSLSQVIDGLCVCVHVARRLLRLRTCLSFARGSPPPKFPPICTGDFRTQKSEASPYPLTKSVHGSAPSPHTLTGKRFPASHG